MIYFDVCVLFRGKTFFIAFNVKKKQIIQVVLTPKKFVQVKLDIASFYTVHHFELVFRFSPNTLDAIIVNIRFGIHKI
jgi:hypothetical protein